MAEHDEAPRYFRLYRDTWRIIDASLTRAQAAKLLYAMAEYFFDGTEPEEGSLPKPAQNMFDMQLAALASYRRNALNGKRNRKKAVKKLSESYQELDQETMQERMQVSEDQQGTSPAETQKVGGEQTHKHAGRSASDIINHESLINNNPPTPTTQSSFDTKLAHLREITGETG